MSNTQENLDVNNNKDTKPNFEVLGDNLQVQPQQTQEQNPADGSVKEQQNPSQKGGEKTTKNQTGKQQTSQQSGWGQGNFKFNKKKKGKKHQTKTSEENHVKNMKWSEEELKELFSENFEVFSKFLDSKTKTHKLLLEPLNSLVQHLNESTKKPSKLVKEIFNEFRKTAEGVCRVLISENDEKFKEDELKSFVVLLKDLKELTTIKSKLNEKDLAKEKQKLVQALENIKKHGNFGNNNVPDPNTFGDACSTILFNLVVAIESLHTIFGNREKFWPKLGGESGLSTTTTSPVKKEGVPSKQKLNDKKKPKKKPVKKFKKKVFKVNNLSKEITEEFGKTVRKNTDEYDGLFDQNDELGDEFRRNDKRKGPSNPSQNPNEKKFGKKNVPAKKKGGDKRKKKGPQSGGYNKGPKFDEKQPVEEKQIDPNVNENVKDQSTEIKNEEGKFETRQPFGVGYHFLINKKVWKNLEATKDAKTVVKDRNDQSDDQQWRFEHLGIGFFRILNKNGKVLSRNEKDEIVLEDLNNERNQNWILVKQFFGKRSYYLIFNVQRTKTLILDLVSNNVTLQFKNGPSDNDAWKIK